MPNTYGTPSSLVFGVPYSITGYILQSTSFTSKPNVSADVFNESGVLVARRNDDIWTDLSVDAVFNGATLPVAGGVFTLSGVAYEVLSVDTKNVNKEFTTVSLKARSTSAITY